MPPTKRRKVASPATEALSDANESAPSDARSVSEHEAASDDGGSESDGAVSSEDEMAEVKRAKSKKTLKRKHRATDANRFGAALQTLLSTDAPSNLPLSLKPSIARKRNDDKLESKGKKVLEVEKKEKEEKGRIQDVIGGWGGESERALRKVAQRGVVKLFNVIQQTQSASAVAAEEVKGQRGTGKPTLPAPVSDKKNTKKGKQKDNIIGRGKEATLGQDDFLDIIRSGGIASKA
ncbi:Rrp15p-domain-containing protein [Fomitopsis betulina]|nr:Rrp15p-domain-containing protein [Fomitopsis betulina]